MFLYHATSLKAAKQILAEGQIEGLHDFVSFSDEPIEQGAKSREVYLVLEIDEDDERFEQVEYTKSWARDNMAAANYVVGHSEGDVSDRELLESFVTFNNEREYLVTGDLAFEDHELVGVLPGKASADEIEASLKRTPLTRGSLGLRPSKNAPLAVQPAVVPIPAAATQLTL